MKRTFDQIMNQAGQKLNFAKASLQGQNSKYRDDVGFAFSAARILQSIENMLDCGTNTKFPIDTAMMQGLSRAFSESRGNFSASDMKGVQDVQVVDIAIAATIKSHGLAYFAMERPMNSAIQSITFQGLKALNTAGGFTAGQKIIDPRTGLPTSFNLGRDGAEVTGGGAVTVGGLFASVDLGAPVVLGSTTVSYTDTSEGTTVQVAKGSGEKTVESGIEYEYMVYTKTGILDDTLKVNLATGNVTGFTDIVTGGMADDDEVTVKAYVDRISESDGAHTIKLRPFNDTVEMEATENRVILNSSVETTAYMNKIYRQNASYGVAVDFGRRAIDQVVTLYTHYIDLLVIKTLYELSASKASLGTVDVSSFDYTGFKTSKNDVLSNAVRTLTTNILNTTSSPCTALAVDTVAANVLATDSENMKLVPAFDEVRDGLIGTYLGIPVVRNAYLTGKVGTPGNGIIIGSHKSRDGNAAAVAFGDYLPPYSTIPAVNPNNPGELSQALFSQTASKGIVEGFCDSIEVKPYSSI